MILFLHFGGTWSDVNEKISHWLMETLDVSLCALVYDQLVLESEALTLNTVCLYTTFTLFLYTALHNTYCLQVHVQTIIVFVFYTIHTAFTIAFADNCCCCCCFVSLCLTVVGLLVPYFFIHFTDDSFVVHLVF